MAKSVLLAASTLETNTQIIQSAFLCLLTQKWVVSDTFEFIFITYWLVLGFGYHEMQSLS